MASVPLSLTLSDIVAVRDRLIANPDAWPSAAGIDTAGIQLILAARLAQQPVPDAVMRSDDVIAKWHTLGLEAVLPLSGPST